jgi:hypothetical protein
MFHGFAAKAGPVRVRVLRPVFGCYVRDRCVSFIEMSRFNF